MKQVKGEKLVRTFDYLDLDDWLHEFIYISNFIKLYAEICTFYCMYVHLKIYTLKFSVFYVAIEANASV